MSPPIVDLSEVVEDFATGVYDVQRFNAGSYVNGVYTDAGFVLLHVSALVVPASGQALLRLPEGDRSTETYQVLSATELMTDERVSQADRIYIPGRGNFEVRSVEDFSATGGFYKYVVQKVDADD